MAQQPTRNRFRTSLTTGTDYSQTPKLTFAPLKISEEGITTREAQLQMQKLENQGNEWDLLAAEFELHTKKHNAHAKQFGAIQAEFGAATAQVTAKTSALALEEAGANYSVQKGRTELALAKVPVMEFQNQIQWGMLLDQVAALELESKKLHEDVEHTRAMNNLNGYDTQVPLELPDFKRPTFTTPSWGLSPQEVKQVQGD